MGYFDDEWSDWQQGGSIVPKLSSVFSVLVIGACFSTMAVAGSPHPEWRALLASPGFEGQPVKGVYFFPGEPASNLDLYTVHPILPDDQHWNSDPTSRTRVLDRIVAAGTNTVVMSYWSNMLQWSPMFLDDSSDPGLLDAVQDRRLVSLPVIEGGFDSKHPDIPHWEFSNDFPSQPGGFSAAPGLTNRIGQLVTLFKGRMKLWAQLYDRTGAPRYAVQILHVCSVIPGTDDLQFARAFEKVAA
jgi:hypothetical protein